MSQNPPEKTSASSDEVVLLDYAAVSPARRAGLATASLVLGILSIPMFALPLGLIPVILGGIALRRVRRDPVRYAGRWQSVSGIQLGVISLILFVAVLVLVPESGSPEMMKRAVSAANLRDIGQGVHIYAKDHQDAFPRDLDVLLLQEILAPTQLINPASGHRPPACDYYYVAGLNANDPPDWIVASGVPAYHDGEGANVLYVDGHVEFIREPDFTKRLDEFRAAFEQDRGAPAVVIAPE